VLLLLTFQKVIELARTARDKRAISLKMPVKEMIVVTQNEVMLDTNYYYQRYIAYHYTMP
jgi:hypothetical protein